MAAGLMALQLFGASASPGTLLWNYSTGAIVNSSPAIGADGTIYFGSDANVTYALTPNGQMKWQVPFGGSPVIALDGSILLGTVDGLKAYRADGSLKWEYATERIVLHVSNLPAVAADGTIYFQGHDARFHALTANGTPKWTLPIDPGLYGGGHPAIAQDGTIYIGTAYGKLFAIDPNGTIKWQFDAGNRINSPAIGPDGTIYAASDDSNLYALAPDKTERWRFTTGGPIYTGAIVGADGRVYVASFDSNLYCLNSNGTKAWHFTAGGGLVGAPALAADGTVYIGGRDSRLRAINPQGVEMWAFVAQHWFDFSSPAIASDGTIYVGSRDGNLYSIKGSAALASSSWPKFGADPASSGRVAAMSLPPYAPTKLRGKLLWVNTHNEIRILDTETGEVSTVPLPLSALPIVSTPSLSPDGQWIVFNGGPSGNSQIYVVRPDGSDLRRVTGGSGDLVWPSWSPDGKRISFHQVYGPVGVVNFDGSGQVNLPVNIAHVRWSPDSKKLVGSNWGFTYDADLFVYEFDTGQTTKITDHGVNETFIFAEWSPDSSKLVVLRGDRSNNHGEIWTMNADGTRPVRLTADWTDSNVNNPTWSPDGQFIVFTSNRGGMQDVWAMRPDGTGRTRITNSPENESGPVYFIPDTIAVLGKLLFANSSNEIWFVNTIKNSKERVPVSGLPIVSTPSLSPDGQWIVFNGGPSGNSQIYVVRPDGSGLRRVTGGSGDLVWPSWSPDGKRISFHQVHGSAGVVNLDGTGQMNLPVEISHVRWSPGKKLVGSNWGFTYDADLFVYEFETRQTTKITNHGVDETFIFAEWSPDSSKLVVLRGDRSNNHGEIWTMNADATGPVRLTADWTDSNVNNPTWSPDGQFIVFTSNRGGMQDVWAMRPDGTGRTRITSSPEIENGPVYFVPVPPEIIGQPASYTISPGQSVTFTVNATGTPPFTYQWQFNGVVLPGQTNPVLTIPKTSLSSAGEYRVIVKNSAGTMVSDAAVLTIVNLQTYAGVVIVGPVGRQYKVEFRDAFSEVSPWQTWTTLTLNQSPYVLIDYDSPSHSKRFYRALLIP
ncbi:MAG: PQQ-binding-like beta-propeller repeat protein [Verrucomicrobiota bacterium]